MWGGRLRSRLFIKHLMQGRDAFSVKAPQLLMLTNTSLPRFAKADRHWASQNTPPHLARCPRRKGRGTVPGASAIRLGPFNARVNLTAFNPTADGDVVDRLDRDARVNIALGSLLPFLAPAMVQAGSNGFEPLSFTLPQTVIWRP